MAQEESPASAAQFKVNKAGRSGGRQHDSSNMRWWPQRGRDHWWELGRDAEDRRAARMAGTDGGRRERCRLHTPSCVVDHGHRPVEVKRDVVLVELGWHGVWPPFARV